MSERTLSPAVQATREAFSRLKAEAVEHAGASSWPAERFHWPIRHRLPDDVTLDATWGEFDIFKINWDLVIWWNTDFAHAAREGYLTGTKDGAKFLSTPITEDLFWSMVARVPRSEMRCVDHLEYAIGHLLRSVSDVTGVPFSVYDATTGVWRREGEWSNPSMVGTSVTSAIDAILGEFEAAMHRAVDLLRSVARTVATPPGVKPAKDDPVAQAAAAHAASLHDATKDAAEMAHDLPRGAYRRVRQALQRRLAISQQMWDSDTRWLVLQDGMVDLEQTHASGAITICEHSPYAMLTMHVPVSSADVDKIYATRESTEWYRGIEKVLPDPDVRAYLQKRYGAALLGRPGIMGKSLVWQFGPGDTAKSTIQECVAGARGVFAPYAMTTSAKALTTEGERTGMTERFKAYARGKRFIIMSELPDGQFLQTDIVKNVTGGETVAGTAKYANEVTYFFTGTIFISSNHPPRFPQGDTALESRIHVVPFTHRLWVQSKNPKEWAAASEAHRADEDWTSKVLSDPRERAAILSWVLDGLIVSGREKGIGALPQAMLDAKEEFASDADPVATLVRSLLGEEPGYEDSAWLKIYTDGEWAAAGFKNSDGVSTQRVKQLIETRARELGLADPMGNIKPRIVTNAQRMLSDRGGAKKRTKVYRMPDSASESVNPVSTTAWVYTRVQEAGFTSSSAVYTSSIPS